MHFFAKSASHQVNRGVELARMDAEDHIIAIYIVMPLPYVKWPS
jgi:hypothetical protein